MVETFLEMKVASYSDANPFSLKIKVNAFSEICLESADAL